MFSIAKGTLPLALVLLLSCKQKNVEKEEKPIYSITEPIIKDTSIIKEYIAQINSNKNIEVRAQEKGFLQKVFVNEGQFVRQGQPLFQIMPQIYQAELLKSKAEVEQATIDLKNATTLSNNNVVSKSEKSMAKAKLDAANAEMKLAQIHLSLTTIKAPFSGIIDRLPLKLGSLVDEGALLTTLSDNVGIYAYFNVSEPEYINYQTHKDQQQNSLVTLIMANGQPLPEKGIIQNIEGQFDNETGNIAFRAKFANPNQLLRNGGTGKIQMAVPLTNAIIIPQKSTFEIQDKKYVFVVDKNGVAKSRNITVAYELPDIFIVSDGLQAGDRFVLEGVQKIKDDQQLKVNFVAPAKVIGNLKYSAN